MIVRPVLPGFWVQVVCVAIACLTITRHGNAATPVDAREYAFPDYPPVSVAPSEEQRGYIGVREQMESASSRGESLTAEQSRNLRNELKGILTGLPDDAPIVPYVKRRLIILDWQSGKISASVASDQLLQLADKQADRERQFTRAMALTIDARARGFDRFRKGFATLDPTQVPQFGWFVSEYARYLIEKYVPESVPPDQRERGQPVAEEYRRSVAIADFLQSAFFPAIDAYLRHAEKGGISGSRDEVTMESAQMPLALKQMTNYIHKALGGRLYLDMSERTTKVLLPRALELWERSVALLQENNPLESPKDHRHEIQVYRKSYIPHLENLQAAQHKLREAESGIAARERNLRQRDRQKLWDLAQHGWRKIFIGINAIAIVVLVLVLIRRLRTSSPK